MTEAHHSLIERLAKHLSRPVDELTRARARLHLLDWLACVAGARQSAVAKLFTGAQGSVINKASFLGNILEMDDVHRTALLHPGPVIWPTALDGLGDDMAALLDAAVRGYEAMVCIGETLDAYHYANWHPTATAGAFGAAATEASRTGCDVGQTAHALALAGSVTGGFWQMRHEDVTAKQWHVAHAIKTGMSAAFYARHGLTGPRFILEGQQGLYAAMTRSPKPLGLTDAWSIHEVSFKPWAACRHAHPVIDAAQELRAAGVLTPPYFVETYADAITFCDRPNPATETDAKFSLQHAVAVVADGRDATPADFTLAAIAALAPLRAQVSVREDPAFTRRYPAHFGARVNGLELIDTRGDPERPVREADTVAKLRTLVAWGGLADVEADRALEVALQGNDVTAVSRMLEDWLG